MFYVSNLGPFISKKAAFIFTDMGVRGHLSAEYIFYIIRRKLMRMNPKAASLINPFNAELITTSHLLALLGAHHILHVSKMRFKGKLD